MISSFLFGLTLLDRIRSTYSSRLQMAGFVDAKGIQAKPTWDEFLLNPEGKGQSKYMENCR
jgi:hypothetical protein